MEEIAMASMTATLETAASPPPAIEDDSLYEVVNGRRVELPPMGAFPTRVASILGQNLGPYAKAKGLGRVDVEMLYRLDDVGDLERRPDVAFVSYQRWPRNQPVPEDAAWDVVPDLAVEVVSPTDRAEAALDKVREYFEAGVQFVWVIYPKLRVVHVFESFTRIRVLTRADDLDGGALLPGFRLPLATLFEDETEETAVSADPTP
jgi:Uma2 family endonuclease